MNNSFKNGDVVVYDDRIVYKTLFGSNTIDKRKIKSVIASSNIIIYIFNFILGIIYMLTIFGIRIGYYMITGMVPVTIFTTSGKHRFWIKRLEVDAFKRCI
jgi:hypothetical protein